MIVNVGVLVVAKVGTLPAKIWVTHANTAKQPGANRTKKVDQRNSRKVDYERVVSAQRLQRQGGSNVHAGSSTKNKGPQSRRDRPTALGNVPCFKAQSYNCRARQRRV